MTADSCAARRVDYLGRSLDWQDGDAAAGPDYLQVSYGPLALHLSTHHGDGTPGGVVLIEVRGIKDLHRELLSTGCQFMNPGLDEGPGEHVLSTVGCVKAGAMSS